jgi:hypothetical protein
MPGSILALNFGSFKNYKNTCSQIGTPKNVFIKIFLLQLVGEVIFSFI